MRSRDIALLKEGERYIGAAINMAPLAGWVPFFNE